MTFDGIKNREWKEVVEGFRQLRRDYEGEISRLGKKYHRGKLPEKERKHLEASLFSRENFEKVLSTDSIFRIKGEMINDMIVDENNLYNFNYAILKKLGSDYKITFHYTGKCTSCGNILERKMEFDKPVLDYKYVNDPYFFNSFFSKEVMCQPCKEITKPVKTFNKFELIGKNDYNVNRILTRKKSEGRLIPKIVELCAGRQEDIRDLHGWKGVCDTEGDCKNFLEVLVKYHKDGKDRIECKDSFELRERKDKSGRTSLENVRYFFYIDKAGKPKKKYIDESLPLQIRSCTDSRGHKTTALYKSIHMPIIYKGTVIEAQVKDTAEYNNENDPKSPLYYDNYAKQRGRSGMFHEEYSERSMKQKWGAFEWKLEPFLEESGLFDGHDPNLYALM